MDNAFDALKHLPVVTPQGDDVNLGGMPVALMVNGKLTSMSREQMVVLLKSMPASRVHTAEVMYSAPARYLHNAHLDYTLPIGLNLGADFTYYEDNKEQEMND